jgi:hypothetical protein
VATAVGELRLRHGDTYSKLLLAECDSRRACLGLAYIGPYWPSNALLATPISWTRSPLLSATTPSTDPATMG